MNICAEASARAADVAVRGGKASALPEKEATGPLQLPMTSMPLRPGSGLLPEAVFQSLFQTLCSSCWADVLTAPMRCQRPTWLTPFTFSCYGDNLFSHGDC